MGAAASSSVNVWAALSAVGRFSTMISEACILERVGILLALYL